MQVHQSVHDFNEIETGVLFAHSFHRFQVVEKLTARAVVKNKTNEIVGFKAVVELDDEGMVEHWVDHFLVLNDVFFLVFWDELFQHDFHCVELPVTQASDQVHFAETSNGKTFADLILFESAFRHVLDAIEGGFFGEDAFTDGDLVVKDGVLIHRFEGDHLSRFEEGIWVMHVEEVLVDFFVENVRQVFVLDSGREFDFEHVAFIVETDNKKSGTGDYLRGFWVELWEIVFSPLKGGSGGGFCLGRGLESFFLLFFLFLHF